MNPTTRNGIIAAIVLIVIVAAVVIYGKAPATSNPPVTVSYGCNAGKLITAVFSAGKDTPGTANTPPVPGGSAALTLADGSTMTLHQTVSADGARYANADESFVFWSKGNGALVLENNVEKTYTGCVAIAPDPGNLPNAYSSGSVGFSIRYPAGYTVTDPYIYTNLGPGKQIGGLKFTIPPALAAGTNLGSDSYISIESLPGAINSCSAEIFLDQPVSAGFVDDGSTRYSVATASGAGAGNRYEETVYATPITNGCIGVRYYIHYSVIENYPAGTVTEFDKAALTAQFDSIRKTLIHQ